jgi:pSer/pThr/pTyr-binding forkhead associated (FHA) protein
MKISVKPQDGKVIEKVVNLNTVTIGRSRNCDLAIDDEALSRKHSQIDLEDGDFYITDLGSANGVYVDGEKISPLAKTKISSFQIITMGPMEFQFFDTENSDSPPHLRGGGPIMRNQDEPTLSQPTRRINRQALNSPYSTKKAPSKEKKPIGMYLSILLIGGVIFGFYQNSTSNEEDLNQLGNGQAQPTQVVETTPEVQKKVPAAPNEFLEATIYLQRGETKTCQNFESLCEEFLLKEKDGIVKIQDEYYIYTDSENYIEQKGFSTHRDHLAIKDAASIYHVLRNNLVDQLGSEVSQIHLILLNKNGEVSTVYRFHPNVLKDAKVEILTSIGSGVNSGNFEAFITLSQKHIPSKEF